MNVLSLARSIAINEMTIIWEDREGKKRLKEVMNEALENGKMPRFSCEKLDIDAAPHYKT